MELTICIEERDNKLERDLFESEEHSRQKKVISKSVSIQYKSHYAFDAVDLPTWLIIGAYVGEHIALPVAVGILSRYLYNKLKDRKESKVTINNMPVEINTEKIEQLILMILKEKEDK
jgi:hypothetical protein